MGPPTIAAAERYAFVQPLDSRWPTKRRCHLLSDQTVDLRQQAGSCVRDFEAGRQVPPQSVEDLTLNHQDIGDS
jgi:hypothetical protein